MRKEAPATLASHAQPSTSTPATKGPQATFDPPQLEQQLRYVIEQLDKHDVSVELENLALAPDFDVAELPGVQFDQGTGLLVTLPRCDSKKVTVAALIALVAEINDRSTSFDGLTYHTSVRTLLRVEPHDMQAHIFIDEGLESNKGLLADGVTVGLSGKSLVFGIEVLRKNLFHDNISRQRPLGMRLSRFNIRRD